VQEPQISRMRGFPFIISFANIGIQFHVPTVFNPSMKWFPRQEKHVCWVAGHPKQFSSYKMLFTIEK
jgi:hypothetical protein